MNEKNKQVSRFWSGPTVIALALIVLGIILTVVTFLTVIGPVIGIMLVAVGAYWLFRTTRSAARAVEHSPDNPPSA